MDGVMIGVVVMWAVFVVLGTLVMPWFVDGVLRRKHAQIEGAFERQLTAFLEVERDPEGADPKDAEECMRWASQMAYMESIGKVEPGMAVRLADAGIVEKAQEPEAYVSIPAERWGLPVGWKSRVACGACSAVLGGVMTLPWLIHRGHEPSSLALPVALCLLFVVLSAVVCDVRAKVIPYQLCGLAVIPSVALAVLTWGVNGFGWCVLGALVATGVLWGSSKLAGLFGVRGSIGMGDVRLLPWCCLPLGVYGTLYGAFAGFGLLFLLAVVVLVSRLGIVSRLKSGCTRLFHGIFAMIRNAPGVVGSLMASPTGFLRPGEGKDRKRRDPAKYLAMGPGIVTWLAVGYACGCMSGAVTIW